MTEAAKHTGETDKRFAADVDALELRYMRGWIGPAEFRAEMVKLYEREDAKDRIDRIVAEAYAKRDRENGDPIQNLVRLAVRLALAEVALSKDAERDAFRAALEEIADPLTAMRKRAEADGGRLSGMAYQIANDPHYLKQIAARALSKGA